MCPGVTEITPPLTPKWSLENDPCSLSTSSVPVDAAPPIFITSVEFHDDMDTLLNNWLDLLSATCLPVISCFRTVAELESSRRLVLVDLAQDADHLHCHFRPLSDSTRSLYSREKGHVVVSCIYWEEKNEYVITSVDTIYLLEKMTSTTFSVEQKNRIRRNLEGFRPLTVAKTKITSATFFQKIMTYTNPKPRNIEKDLKVFRWKILPFAIQKIIQKYVGPHETCKF